MKVSLKMLNLADFDSFSDYLNTVNYSNFRLFIFVGMLQVLKFEFLQFSIFEILNFHPSNVHFTDSSGWKHLHC